ncbi:hypothetical protein D9M70_497170 [compost metagenome]
MAPGDAGQKSIGLVMEEVVEARGRIVEDTLVVIELAVIGIGDDPVVRCRRGGQIAVAAEQARFTLDRQTLPEVDGIARLLPMEVAVDTHREGRESEPA